MRQTKITDDLKALPGDLRDSARTTERKLDEAVSERPLLRWALDWRVVLTAATLALLGAVVARFAGFGFLLSLLVFLVLFGALWAGISNAAAARPPTSSS